MFEQTLGKVAQSGSKGTSSGSGSGTVNTGACTGGAGCVVAGRTTFLPDCVAAPTAKPGDAQEGVKEFVFHSNLRKVYGAGTIRTLATKRQLFRRIVPPKHSAFRLLLLPPAPAPAFCYNPANPPSF
jgi:hypothetical protein